MIGSLGVVVFLDLVMIITIYMVWYIYERSEDVDPLTFGVFALKKIKPKFSVLTVLASNRTYRWCGAKVSAWKLYHHFAGYHCTHRCSRKCLGNWLLI